MSHKDLIRVGWMVVTIQPTTIPWPMFDLPAFLKKTDWMLRDICFIIFMFKKYLNNNAKSVSRTWNIENSNIIDVSFHGFSNDPVG